MGHWFIDKFKDNVFVELTHALWPHDKERWKRLRVVSHDFESDFKKLNLYSMGHWFIDKFKDNVFVELTTD